VISLIKKYFETYTGFAVPYLLFVLAGFAFILFFQKGDLVLFFNNHRSDFQDLFFKNATKLAEVVVFIPVFALVLWYGFGNFFILAVGFIFNSVLVQILKKLVFDAPRPALFFKDVVDLNFIDSVSVYYHHSFPSGHTASGFLVFALLAVFTKNKWLQLLCFLSALSVGVSRIYLLLHFEEDVLAGAVLGVFSAYFVYYFLHKMEFLSFQKWKHQSLSHYLRK
jgi:membrane-associated phospholipid phosphatase